MTQRVFGFDIGERRSRHLAERPARRGQDDAPDFFGAPAVQALMNRVVLAVDGKNGHAPCARRGSDERAGHHEHFLIRERDGLAGVDGGKNSLERVSARRSADDDIDVGMGGDGDQPFAARL